MSDPVMVEKTGVHSEQHQNDASNWSTWSHEVVISPPWHKQESNSQSLEVIATE